MRSDACPRDARQSAARAISAYSMSWASGRTPARMADARITQEIYWRKLRVTNQVVRARYDVQQAAMQELAAAGAAYQNLFRNPLVSPDILGVSAGAALGATLGIFFSLDLWWIQGLAFAWGLGAVAAVYLVGQAVRGHDPILVLILAGVVIGALLGSVLALLKYLADPYNQLPAITFWLLGSLAATNLSDIATTLARRLNLILPTDGKVLLP